MIWGIYPCFWKHPYGLLVPWTVSHIHRKIHTAGVFYFEMTDMFEESGDPPLGGQEPNGHGKRWRKMTEGSIGFITNEAWTHRGLQGMAWPTRDDLQSAFQDPRCRCRCWGMEIFVWRRSSRRFGAKWTFLGNLFSLGHRKIHPGIPGSGW